MAAARYVDGVVMRCTAPRTPVRSAGDGGATAVSELLFGEDFEIFDVVAGWAYGRCGVDQYVGWVDAAALGEAIGVITQRVTAKIAPLFSAPDIKAPVIAELPFGARVAGTAGDRFLALGGGGYIHNRHVAALPSGQRNATDPVGIARIFSGTPYLWGGRTPDGVDCSGLVQAALLACGIACPRDSDQQRDELGAAVAFDARRAGDLMFFPGHVGFLTGRDMLFHANAHWMSTVEEPLSDVIARLHAAGVAMPVTGIRRI